MAARSDTFVLLLFFLPLQIIEAEASCSKGKCQTYALNIYRDAVENSELVGHVFQKSATVNPILCHSLCVEHCRCLSFNYKKNAKGKVCELNEESHYTKKSSLKHSPGSQYYNLRRESSKQGMTSCDDDATCVNGCCKSNPCVNGGTCEEVCEPTSVRYRCHCPVPFIGRHCDRRATSCQAYKAAGEVTSGIYNITDDSNRTLQVFCDFHAEPGYAWNLIESFSLSNVGLFGAHSVFYNYSDSNAVSSDSPNWQAYLIRPHDLAWLRSQSTHWRATCQYNTNGTVYRDYLRASFEDFDIIGTVPTVLSSCRKYEFVNIRGNECTNCTAQTYYMKGKLNFHISIDCRDCCDLHGNLTGDSLWSEDNFGHYYYSGVNKKFRCTSSPEATTQFWVGGK